MLKNIFIKLYYLLIVLILVVSTSAIYFYSINSDNKNYLAIIEVNLQKNIDHIFLEQGDDKLILEFAERILINEMPKNKWEITKANTLETKIYTSDKKSFYGDDLPLFVKKMSDVILQINKEIQVNIGNLLEDQTLSTMLKEDVSKEIFYYRLLKKPFYSGLVKTNIRFRKLGLTQFEFMAITLFLGLSSISLLTSFYIVRKKTLNNK